MALSIINILSKMMYTYDQLYLDYTNYEIYINELKSKRNTRLTSTKIKQYRLLSRQNIYDRMRISTEVFYYIRQYADELLLDSSFKQNFMNKLDHYEYELQTNQFILFPSSKEEVFIVNALKDEIHLCKKILNY
jgi:hypothetical protein